MKRNVKKISCSLMLFLAITALAGCNKSRENSAYSLSSTSIVSANQANESSTFETSMVSLEKNDKDSQLSSSEENHSSISSIISEDNRVKHNVTLVKFDGTQEVIKVADGDLLDEIVDDKNGITFLEWQFEDGSVFSFDTPIVEDIQIHSVGRISITYDNLSELDASFGMSLWNKYKVSVPYYGGTSDYTIPQISSRYENLLFDAYDSSGMKINQQPLLPGDTISLSSNTKIVPQGTVEEISVQYDGYNYSYSISNGYLRITNDIPDVEDNEYFVGWKIQDNGQVYRAGDLVYLDPFIGNEVITFEPYIITLEEDSTLYVDNFDDLIYSSEDYKVLVLTDDIDAEGADTDTGIGGGSWKGVILGQGHTISNFTIDVDDCATNSGLIDYSEHLEVYDLNVSSIELSSYSSFGAGVIVGEVDGSAIFNNVNVSNVTIDTISTTYWSEHYFDSIKMEIVEREEPSNNSIRGLGGIIGTVTALDMKNCSVDNFSSEPAIEEQNEISSSITIGGLVGSTFTCGIDEVNYGIHISESCVRNSNLSTKEKVYGFVIGGIIGTIDSDEAYSGVEIYRNTVENTSLSVINSATLKDKGSVNYVGGLVGYNYSFVANRIGEAIVPNYIYQNYIESNISVSIDDEAFDSGNRHEDCLGGIFGYTYFDLGSNNELGFEYKVEQNYYSGNINLESKYANCVRVGGLAGFVGFDNEDYAIVTFANNYILSDIEINNTSKDAEFYDSRIGGLFGFAATGSSDETFVSVISGNVVMGKIISPENAVYGSTSGISRLNATASLIGVYDNDLGQNYITNNISLEAMKVGNNTENSNTTFFYFGKTATGEQVDSYVVATGNKTSASLSTVDNGLGVTNISSNSDNFIQESGLDASIWSYSNGNPVLLWTL